MMKKLRLTLIIAALSLGTTGLLPINALSYTPAHTILAAGSSAMYQPFAMAAGYNTGSGAYAARTTGPVERSPRGRSSQRQHPPRERQYLDRVG